MAACQPGEKGWCTSVRRRKASCIAAKALQTLTINLFHICNGTAGQSLERASVPAVSPGRGGPGHLWDQEGEVQALCPYLLPGTPDASSRRQPRSKMGATITCWKTGCDRSFHLPCAPQGECVTQFFGLYRSFCWEHRPRQAVQARPRQNNTCSICLDTVEDKTSYKTMVCPACQDAHFHRHCIQRLALHAGTCFRCPCCQNQELFLMEMLTMGIRISKRPPSWESDPAVGALDQRHSRCDASTCLCPGGRKHTEEEGPWELLLCSSCAAEGTHRHCSSLASSTSSWECKGCAGTETGSTDNSELVRPNTSSQAASGLCHASSSFSRHPGPAQIQQCTQRLRQAQNSGSPTVKCPRINRVPLLSAETSSLSTSSQAGSRLSQNTLPVCFPCPRQGLKRQRQEQDNESWTPYSPPAKRRRISEEPAQSAPASGPSTSSQASWLYRSIWVANRAIAQLLPLYRPSWLFPSSVRENRSQLGPVRMRHISRRQRRARKPYSLPQNHRRTRRAPAPCAGSPPTPQKHKKKRK
ncbi:PREDICTED: G2/M phase-specific E3 ubiquitin-protein ligase-like isoform X2 [Lepidothrix coronata]|uniref:G2/M phase-specific E3 ubiquitin-protein ligase-like isoform X2 n=1 Tax=Lepidothrix coronata TaxID=321398 RepID=A0A6J0GRU7_9PASS|nr:PREDICTED: G2/M phase-specific E3 ubiquitin-protein ligase-like isoform X2 [Lepidothrix coronata]